MVTHGQGAIASMTNSPKTPAKSRSRTSPETRTCFQYVKRAGAERDFVDPDRIREAHYKDFEMIVLDV